MHWACISSGGPHSHVRRTWKKRRNLNTSKTTNMPHNSRCDAKNLNCRALAVHETKQERQGQNSKVSTCSAPQSSAEPERGRWRIFILYCTFTNAKSVKCGVFAVQWLRPAVFTPSIIFSQKPPSSNCSTAYLVANWRWQCVTILLVNIFTLA